MAAPPSGDFNSYSSATHPAAKNSGSSRFASTDRSRSRQFQRQVRQSGQPPDSSLRQPTRLEPRSKRQGGRNLTGSAQTQVDQGPNSVVHSFRPKPHPFWLRFLLMVQRGSSVMTVFLVAGMLAVYGWTVYVQQRWGHEYEQLEALKKRERQLTSANELLKNQMAEQAENPTTGLLLPDPSNAIFLTPAPQRSEVKPKPTNSPVPFQNKPLGY